MFTMRVALSPTTLRPHPSRVTQGDDPLEEALAGEGFLVWLQELEHVESGSSENEH